MGRQLRVLHEGYLQLAADFDSFRKRTARDLQRAAAEQKEAFIRELLPVLDNLERALACSRLDEPEQFRSGVHMTLNQATRLLLRHGFVPRDDVGQTFDPGIHEAVEVRTEAALSPNTVVEVWQRGWMLDGRPFRPAKVVVSDGGSGQETRGKK